MTLTELQTTYDFLEEQEEELVEFFRKRVGKTNAVIAAHHAASELLGSLQEAIRFSEEEPLDDPEGWPE